jgi:hypothetical protein
LALRVQRVHRVQKVEGKVAAPPQFIAPFPRKGVALKAPEDSRLFAEKPRPQRCLM